MILMIDNYDSFTWNLVQYLFELGAEVEVVRNDQLNLADVESWRTEEHEGQGSGRPAPSAKFQAPSAKFQALSSKCQAPAASSF